MMVLSENSNTPQEITQQEVDKQLRDAAKPAGLIDVLAQNRLNSADYKDILSDLLLNEEGLLKQKEIRLSNLEEKKLYIWKV